MKSLLETVRELDKNYLTEADIKNICLKATRQYKSLNTSALIMMSEIIQEILLKEKKDVLNSIKDNSTSLYETVSKSIKVIEKSRKYTVDERDKIAKSINYKSIDKFLRRNNITYTRRIINRLETNNVLYIIQMHTSYIEFKIIYNTELSDFVLNHHAISFNEEDQKRMISYSTAIADELYHCNHLDEFNSYFAELL